MSLPTTSATLPGAFPGTFPSKCLATRVAYPMNNMEESEDVRSIKDAMRDDKIKTAFIMGAETSLRTYLREKSPVKNKNG